MFGGVYDGGVPCETTNGRAGGEETSFCHACNLEFCDAILAACSKLMTGRKMPIFFDLD